MEAALNGVSTAAYRQGGLAEVLGEGDTACLVDTGNVTALAEAMECLIGSPAERVRIGRVAVQLVRSHDWAHALDRVLRVYDELAGGEFFSVESNSLS